MDLGLLFTSQSNATLESYIHYPIEDSPSSLITNPSLATFCNANWNPQDACHPSSSNIQQVSIQETKSICGHIFFYGGCAVFQKNFLSAELHLMQRLKLQMNVSKMFRCSEISCPILTYFNIPLLLLSSITIMEQLTGHIHLVQKEWDTWIFERMPSVKHNLSMKSQSLILRVHPADTFTKEFKSNSTFCSLWDLLLFLSTAFSP